MSFSQLPLIRKLRQASIGQLIGFLVLLALVVSSTGLRVEATTEFGILGEQLIGHVEIRQLAIEEFELNDVGSSNSCRKPTRFDFKRLLNARAWIDTLWL